MITVLTGKYGFTISLISERVAIDEPTLIPAAREADDYVLLSLYVFAQNSKHTTYIIVYSALQGLVHLGSL